ncbi:M16 family metallopeptidase [Halorhodospira halophila]|uniref:Peptidase M16 domain protein n=1 Tax=Halorhodospira halophila (strain DSM 244 / SL1) TaxID=349124 RepID=A1WZF7_HALHL|nr:pitrilysin family protein [Halorhodospira halophila]ABM63069.1 peptidase M16 domain protein [Halorhodospira halophila SL1]MBK1727809.1 insulinase family protein [Halorhodospira halophila]
MALRRLLTTLLLASLAPLAAADRVHHHELDNGLTVLVQEDHRGGVVASMLWYHVGSGHEHRPITGISHAVEHMMFKGTETRETGEFARQIAREGGQTNAFTARDFTGYFQLLAADRLELAMELEADRMHQLVFDPEEFQREMQVIHEERRQRVDDPPEARAFERFTATAHMASPYRHPIIGWQRDLDRLRLEELEAWYQRWYTPSNATLVVVGAVEPERVFELAERHFGEVPAREAEPQPEGREIDAAPGERRIEVRFDDARVPMLFLGYNVPSLATAADPGDAYALLLAAELLDGGRSARLPEALVRGSGVATSASAGYSPVARLDTLFSLVARPADDQDLDDLESALREQIHRLQEEPVADSELERAMTRLFAAEVYARDAPMGRAQRLGRLASTGIGWEEAQRFEERVRAVSPEAIQRAAETYLQPERLTVGRLLPGEED